MSYDGSGMEEKQMAEYVRGFRARMEREERRRREAAEAARAALPRALEILRRVPTVRRVYLFGSLPKGTYEPGSDVDLAIEGDIPGNGLYRAWSEMEEASGLKVDLRILKDLPFANLVRKHGEVVLENP